MNRALLVIIGAGAALAVLIVINRKPVSVMAQEAGAAVAGAVVDTASGAVLGIGDAIGVPRTEMTECQRAKAEGRTWDASFACPAGDFLSYVFKG